LPRDVTATSSAIAVRDHAGGALRLAHRVGWAVSSGCVAFDADRRA
jgi:hypothetical protein